VADVPGFGPVLAAAVVERLHAGDLGEDVDTQEEAPAAVEELDAALPG
jgi:hypothetical protein